MKEKEILEAKAKMSGKFIKWHELRDGDIFYCDPEVELNDGYCLGMDWEMSGKDQIFIKDDNVEFNEDFSGSVLVNGGHVVEFDCNDEVFLLGRYSQLLDKVRKARKTQVKA